MAVLNIDGIGEVDIDDGFLNLSPAQQAKEVDAIAAQIKGGSAPAPEAAPDPNSEEGVALQQINASQPKPDTLASRSAILPVGKTKEGNLTLAVPGFLEGPRQAVMDLLDGKRTASQLTGKEIFELGSLFAGAPAGGPAGTGAGIARAAAEREAVAGAPKPAAAPAAVAPEAAATTVDDALRAAAPEPAPAPPAAPAVAEPAVATATNEELRAAAKGFYRRADEAGVTANPIRPLFDDVKSTVIKEGIDPTLHPRATAALQRMEAVADQPISFQNLEILRRVANGAGKGLDKDEGRIAGHIVDKIDDFVSKLSAKDVSSGDAKVAAEMVTKARDLWSKVAKLDTVDGLVERARLSAPNFSGSGLENALRTEFRSLAKNARALRTFTPQEQKAIKKIAVGTTASNAARNVGKLAPTGVVSAGLGGGIGAAAGSLIGMPVVGAIAAGAAGFGARRLATAMAERYVKQLETTIRTGGDSKMATEALARSKASLQLLKSAPQAESAAAASKDNRRR